MSSQASSFVPSQQSHPSQPQRRLYHHQHQQHNQHNRKYSKHIQNHFQYSGQLPLPLPAQSQPHQEPQCRVPTSFDKSININTPQQYKQANQVNYNHQSAGRQGGAQSRQALSNRHRSHNSAPFMSIPSHPRSTNPAPFVPQPPSVLPTAQPLLTVTSTGRGMVAEETTPKFHAIDEPRTPEWFPDEKSIDSIDSTGSTSSADSMDSVDADPLSLPGLMNESLLSTPPSMADSGDHVVNIVGLLSKFSPFTKDQLDQTNQFNQLNALSNIHTPVYMPTTPSPPASTIYPDFSGLPPLFSPPVQSTNLDYSPAHASFASKLFDWSDLPHNRNDALAFAPPNTPHGHRVHTPQTPPPPALFNGNVGTQFQRRGTRFGHQASLSTSTGSNGSSHGRNGSDFNNNNGHNGPNRRPFANPGFNNGVNPDMGRTRFFIDSPPSTRPLSMMSNGSSSDSNSYSGYIHNNGADNHNAPNGYIGHTNRSSMDLDNHNVGAIGSGPGGWGNVSGVPNRLHRGGRVHSASSSMSWSPMADLARMLPAPATASVPRMPYEGPRDTPPQALQTGFQPFTTHHRGSEIQMQTQPHLHGHVQDLPNLQSYNRVPFSPVERRPGPAYRTSQPSPLSPLLRMNTSITPPRTQSEIILETTIPISKKAMELKLQEQPVSGTPLCDVLKDGQLCHLKRHERTGVFLRTGVKLEKAFKHFTLLRDLQHLVIGLKSAPTHHALAHTPSPSQLNNGTSGTLYASIFEVPDDAIISLFQSLPALVEARLHGFTKLTRRSFDAALIHCSNLQVLSITGTRVPLSGSNSVSTKGDSTSISASEAMLESSATTITEEDVMDIGGTNVNRANMNDEPRKIIYHSGRAHAVGGVGSLQRDALRSLMPFEGPVRGEEFCGRKLRFIDLSFQYIDETLAREVTLHRSNASASTTTSHSASNGQGPRGNRPSGLVIMCETMVRTIRFENGIMEVSEPVDGSLLQGNRRKVLPVASTAGWPASK